MTKVVDDDWLCDCGAGCGVRGGPEVWISFDVSDVALDQKDMESTEGTTEYFVYTLCKNMCKSIHLIAARIASHVSVTPVSCTKQSYQSS